MFLVLSIIYFINSVRYEEGVVFGYPYSVFLYSIKVSASVGFVMSSGIWWFIVSGGDKRS
jgi:hypothetical protein